jgi:hypothetical protein
MNDSGRDSASSRGAPGRDRRRLMELWRTRVSSIEPDKRFEA